MVFGGFLKFWIGKNMFWMGFGWGYPKFWNEERGSD
jgi:hypothetical protein